MGLPVGRITATPCSASDGIADREGNAVAGAGYPGPFYETIKPCNDIPVLTTFTCEHRIVNVSHKLAIGVAKVVMMLCIMTSPAMAQANCPAPHDDYRKPTRVWAGFGYQVNACASDKIEVPVTLVVSATDRYGLLKIEDTLPWYLDLAGLSSDQLDNLRDSCQNDMPCVARFKIRIIEIQHTCEAEVLNNWMTKTNEHCTPPKNSTNRTRMAQ